MANQADKHRSSVGHDGRSKAFAKPGEPTLLIHHDPNVARTADNMRDVTKSNLARDGAPKRLHPVAYHSGNTRQQIDMAGVGGMGHATKAPDASAANPLAPTVPGKTFAPAQPVPGQRSRIVNDKLGGSMPGENHARAATRGGNLDLALGKAVLDEAYAASSPDDRRAHARE